MTNDTVYCTMEKGKPEAYWYDDQKNKHCYRPTRGRTAAQNAEEAIKKYKAWKIEEFRKLVKNMGKKK